MPGLGTSLGRGGATTFQQDLQNSDCILIMGSNMAECHPVGFQWVVEAKERGAKVIHVDPRFTRTSALADLHVPLRAGSDIAFLGALVNHILEKERWFREYVVAYTNAATIVDERFEDTEDLGGLFSGFLPDKQRYDLETWQYAGMAAFTSIGTPEAGSALGEQAHYAAKGELKEGDPPETDPTLEHPRCVFQLLRRHFARYTPEFVEEVCGVPRERFLEVAEALCDNSGRERTTALCYSVGWTQHSVGVQYIRAASIVQLLLGNIGRPGGGILALRGHASIQGSTDIPTLYNILPGYLPMPSAGQDLEKYLAAYDSPTSFWAYLPRYLRSLLAAWWGDAATEEDEYGFDWLPRLTGDHSVYPTVLDMLEGKVRGWFLLGENPAVGSPNSGLHRRAMAKLDWLVVRDLQEIESASFWRDSPEVRSGELRTEDIGTEVFLLPAASHVEKDGTFTNTQRLLQWHHTAVEPEGDCRSDLWFAFHLGRLIRERLARRGDPKDRPMLELTWDYVTSGPTEEPSADSVLREINGFDSSGRLLGMYTELADDGSTACGCWIYCGCYADGVNQTARKKPAAEQDWVASEWAWAWPDNRRILYNRASADPEGNPWSERKRYVWWDADEGAWTGYDKPDFKRDMPPDYVPEKGAKAEMALRGDEPFVMQADGRAWLFVPTGLTDGPLPTHYEPIESPFGNPLYPEQSSNPARQQLRDRYDHDRFPFVMTSYRLTEHHTAGGMSRTVPRLAELQPEMFCEVSPELAFERGLENGGMAVISSARGSIRARVLVTERMKPIRVQGRTAHQVGLPYHWGYSGHVKGDSANDLFHLGLDSNVHIQETKAATCDIRPA